MSKQRSSIDWENIEREYRAGQLSIAEIARQNGCSRPTIIQKAARLGWTRDLTDAVRREIKSRLVATDALQSNATPCNTQEAIDTAASRGVEIVRRHRRLLATLSACAEGVAEAVAARLDAAKTGDTETEGLQASFSIIGDRESLSDAMEKASRSAHKLIALERQAYNLDDREAGSSEPMTLVFEAYKPKPSA